MLLPVEKKKKKKKKTQWPWTPGSPTPANPTSPARREEKELARGDGLNRIPKTMDGLWDSTRLRGPWGHFEERGKAAAERQTDG